jgi:hypothetical protein
MRKQFESSDEAALVGMPALIFGTLISVGSNLRLHENQNIYPIPI